MRLSGVADGAWMQEAGITGRGKAFAHMQIHHITFNGINQAACETVDRDLRAPDAGAIVQLHYTCISAGTELAKLSGLQPIEYPTGPMGNRAVGRVLEPGCEREDLQVGDFVFCHAPHASHFEVHGLLAKLPESLDVPEAATLGMAMVAFAGLRVGQSELGDTVIVTGAGLVGQFTAQLLQLSGARTILIDPVPERLAIARQCGIEWCVSPEEAPDTVTRLTNGHGAECIYECTGVPSVVEASVRFAARSAQVVMVGSPRGGFQTDLTEFLNAFHLWRPHAGDLTLKGAHEWKIPLYPEQSSKHSLERNAKILGDLVVTDRLKLAPLLTAVFDPVDVAQAYGRLTDEKDRHLGTVFDWTASVRPR